MSLGTPRDTIMTSKQRVLAAANHKQPDRTPITFDAEKEVYTPGPLARQNKKLC